VHDASALPTHTVRVSARARRVRLVVTPREGLVVVVPRGFPTRRIGDVLREHASWIERALARTAEQRAHAAALADAPLPERVEMRGIGLAWTVSLRPSAGERVRGTLHGAELVLSGAVNDRTACYAALRRAVSRAARERLPLMLGGIEAETGWSASRVSVRRQKTRWGSCSAAGAVSLNEALAFLPTDLVRFVLVHELAHTVQLDHSAAFWAHVERHDADWRGLRRRLRDGWRHVPPWWDSA
jgi:predicted metal-dependent hydrolase